MAAEARQDGVIGGRRGAMVAGLGLTQRRKDAKEGRLTENEVAKVVVDAAFKVHTALGPGLLTYLRLSHRKLGLLINFGAPLIKDGITRVVNGLDR